MAYMRYSIYAVTRKNQGQRSVGLKDRYS